MVIDINAIDAWAQTQPVWLILLLIVAEIALLFLIIKLILLFSERAIAKGGKK